MKYENIPEIEESIILDARKNGGKLSKETREVMHKAYKQCTENIVEAMQILDKVAEEFDLTGTTTVENYLDIAMQCEKDSEFKRFLGAWIDRSIYMDLIEYETGFIEVQRKTVQLKNGIRLNIEIEGGQARVTGTRDGKLLDKIYTHNLILTDTEKKRLVKQSIEEFKNI